MEGWLKWVVKSTACQNQKAESDGGPREIARKTSTFWRKLFKMAKVPGRCIQHVGAATDSCVQLGNCPRLLRTPSLARWTLIGKPKEEDKQPDGQWND